MSFGLICGCIICGISGNEARVTSLDVDTLNRLLGVPVLLCAQQVTR